MVQGTTYQTNINQVTHKAEPTQKAYTFDLNQPHYSILKEPTATKNVAYSIKYRPAGSAEWILLRGWWYDNGIWTAEGIFTN